MIEIAIHLLDDADFMRPKLLQSPLDFAVIVDGEFLFDFDGHRG